MKDKKIVSTFKINLEDKAELQEMARTLGITFSDLLREGARLFGSFDKFFLDKVREYSTKFKISPSLIIQNMMLKQMAYEAAEVEIYGKVDRIRNEFAFNDDGPITGEVLFSMLKEQYRNEIERDK